MALEARCSISVVMPDHQWSSAGIEAFEMLHRVQMSALGKLRRRS